MAVQKRGKRLTRDDVQQAAEQLTAENKNVTTNAIIALIGGSFSTIGPLLKEWRAQAEQSAAARLAMPDRVTEVLSNAIAEVWQVTSQVAAEELERIEETARTALQQATDEVAEYAREVERLEKTTETLMTEKKDAITALNRIVGDHEKCKDLNNQLKVKQARDQALIEGMTQELTETRKRMEALESRNTVLQQELLTLAKRASSKK